MEERNLLTREYPGFILDLADDGTAFALGYLGATPQLRQRYEVLIELPPNYGTGALPMVRVLTPELRPSAPHRFTNGALCVEHGNAFTPHSTLITLLAWVTAWLLLYEAWCDDGIPWN